MISKTMIDNQIILISKKLKMFGKPAINIYVYTYDFKLYNLILGKEF